MRACSSYLRDSGSLIGSEWSKVWKNGGEVVNLFGRVFRAVHVDQEQKQTAVDGGDETKHCQQQALQWHDQRSPAKQSREKSAVAVSEAKPREKMAARNGDSPSSRDDKLELRHSAVRNNTKHAKSSNQRPRGPQGKSGRDKKKSWELLRQTVDKKTKSMFVAPLVFCNGFGSSFVFSTIRCP